MTLEASSQPLVTVAVIDAHDVVHAGIAAWCASGELPIRLVGAFRNSSEFMASYPQTPHDVDVVVFDLQLDGGRLDFDSLRVLCARDERVVVFCDLTADEVILTSLENGAITYLVKSEGRKHLLDAIQAAGTTRPHVGPRMARALRNDSILGRVRLSDREKEVLIAWFQTESKDEVGRRLFIAPTTVRTHLQRARAKYASIGRPAPTKSALLARAIEDGILTLQDL
ncbi:MAG TPA: LuxR C-terminal-related transcriptional regulator [Mycobacterium sp.]|nr:LuxR C-terminal-related transcriptional regulator [Mycobacterium sp.]HQE14102.1 LuxR C-terminal-related transcriptional regulator [Mycobacterium sp.]